MKCEKHGLVLDKYECSRCKDENKDKRIEELEDQLADKFKTFEEWKASAVECKELSDSVIVLELKATIERVHALPEKMESQVQPAPYAGSYEQGYEDGITDFSKELKAALNGDGDGKEKES